MASKRATTLSVSFVSGVALFLAASSAVHSAVLAPVFRVEEIEAFFPADSKVAPRRYRLLPPTSIFLLDLGTVAQALQRRHPTIEVEEVRRILPNRLRAFLSPRRPAAQLKTESGYYLVSDGGVILASGRSSAWPHLVLLWTPGIRGPYRVGQTLKDRSFFRGMEVLAMLRAKGTLTGRQVNSLQVKGSGIFLLVDHGLEIRLEDRTTDAALDRLAQILLRPHPMLEGARYIDLRFTDPVIGWDQPASSASVRRRKR